MDDSAKASAFPAAQIPPLTEDCHAYLTLLAALFEQMDRAYQSAAEAYGFECRGCRDNCCQTRFYHHTLLEYYYLMQGYRRLERKRRVKIMYRAREACSHTDTSGQTSAPRLHQCPLNFDGRCILYQFRPMICRLHGIPHQLHHPRNGIRYGPGCGEFARLCGQREYVAFDRTPFYSAIAQLEKELRQAIDATQKLKLTVAEMIMAWNFSVQEPERYEDT